MQPVAGVGFGDDAEPASAVLFQRHGPKHPPRGLTFAEVIPHAQADRPDRLQIVQQRLQRRRQVLEAGLSPQHGQEFRAAFDLAAADLAEASEREEALVPEAGLHQPQQKQRLHRPDGPVQRQELPGPNAGPSRIGGEALLEHLFSAGADLGEGALDIEVVHPDAHPFVAEPLLVAAGVIGAGIDAILGDIGRHRGSQPAGPQEGVQHFQPMQLVFFAFAGGIEDQAEAALGDLRPGLGRQVRGAGGQLHAVGAGDHHHVGRRRDGRAGLLDGDRQALVSKVVEKGPFLVRQQHTEGPVQRGGSSGRRRSGGPVRTPDEALTAVERPLLRAAYKSVQVLEHHGLPVHQRLWSPMR